MVIASGQATINTTKYRVSSNPDTGLNYRLHILPAQSEDEAIYRCNAGINKVYFIQLTLLELPRSLGIRNASTDNRLIGTEGQDLFIECVAVGGVPAPTLSLVVLGTTVQTGVQELRYILRNIPRIYDTTNVSCLANSDALDIPITATALIYLNLMPLMPVFSVPLVTTKEMVPFSISCTSTGSRPAAAFWWILGQNDVTIKASSQENKNADETFNVTSTLTYSVNRQFNLQHIICTANNTIGGFSNQISLFVRSQPVFTADNHERNIQYGNIGKTVDIVVHVFSVPKFIYNAWFNNGKQIQTSTKFLFSESSAEVEDVFHGKTVKVDGYKSILTIYDLQNEDFTYYTLILENGIGKPVEHTVVLERSTPIEPETLSSGGIIGAVCGGLISILVVMVVMVFIIIKTRKGHQQSETTVKFEKTDSDDHTHNYEEVQNSSGTQNESNINRDQSPIKHYEALGLQDVPNAYDNLSNEALQANRDQRPSGNYEKLGLKDAPNVYEDLTDKESQKIGGQSSRTHYEDLGRKKEAYVYDDLNIEACEETTAKSPTQYYEELGVKNNPTVYSDLKNADAENKVYENASKQWTQEN